MGKIRNPKSEIRKKPESQISKYQKKSQREILDFWILFLNFFRISDFGFLSDFGFRISDFGF